VRARCGNRLSESRQVPVNDHEPPAAALDVPLESGPPGALGSSALVFPVPVSSAGAAPFPQSFPLGGSAEGGLVPFPYWPAASSQIADLSQGAEASTPSLEFAPVPSGLDQSSGPLPPPPLQPSPAFPFEPPLGPPHEPPVVTPEPSTLLLLGPLVAGYLAQRRRRCRKQQ